MADIGKFDRVIFGDLQQFDTTIAFSRTIIEPTITVSDSVGIKIDFKRVIIEPTISIIDSVVRILIKSLPNIRFITRVLQSLSFTTRIKDTEDHST